MFMDFLENVKGVERSLLCTTYKCRESKDMHLIAVPLGTKAQGQGPEDSSRRPQTPFGSLHRPYFYLRRTS